MCLAVPGKIVEIKNGIATVDYELEKRSARLVDSELKVGDYVIVQGGIAVMKIETKEAQEALKNYKESISS